MKIIFTLIAIYSIYAPLFSQCADNENIYVFTHNDKTYEVVKETKTWVDASACAIERNGYLAEINDLNEQNEIYNAIIGGAGVQSTYTSISSGGGIAYVWIGATDQLTEGTWIWDGNNDNTGLKFWTGQGTNGAGNGLPSGGAYNNWGGTSAGVPKEPDNDCSSQHYAAIGLAGWPSGTTMLGKAGEWNDIIGTSQLYFVIEKNSSTSIQENNSDLDKDLRIYPNPTNGTLNIDIDYKLIEIFDVNGKLLKQFSYNQAINISGLEENIYFIRIIGDSFVKTKKIILD